MSNDTVLFDAVGRLYCEKAIRDYETDVDKQEAVIYVFNGQVIRVDGCGVSVL